MHQCLWAKRLGDGGHEGSKAFTILPTTQCVHTSNDLWTDKLLRDLWKLTVALEYQHDPVQVRHKELDSKKTEQSTQLLFEFELGKANLFCCRSFGLTDVELQEALTNPAFDCLRHVGSSSEVSCLTYLDDRHVFRSSLNDGSVTCLSQ